MILKNLLKFKTNTKANSSDKLIFALWISIYVSGLLIITISFILLSIKFKSAMDVSVETTKKARINNENTKLKTDKLKEFYDHLEFDVSI